MKSRSNPFKRAEFVSPWLTIGVLTIMASALPNRYENDPASLHQRQRIAEAMNDVPYFINGKWVGEDARDKIPREAQQLLRPNAILSRTFTAPGEPAMHVLVIHCSDARDMIGHYPPVCYPSSGWLARGPVEGVARQWILSTTGTGIEVREYQFSRARNLAGEDVIRVYNTFVLPDGVVTPNIQTINKQSERLAVTVRGVAQVQVITMAGVPSSQAESAAADLLSGMSDLFKTLAISEGESS